MNPQHWRQINQLFHRALQRKSEERAGFLAQACTDDLALIAEINGLLAAHEESSDLIDYPAHEFAAQILAAAPDTLATGEQLNVYRILSQIGVGGMGEVYLADDTRLERKVALKVLPAVFTHDTKRLAQFHREAKAAAALNHPNIATIYSIEETGEHHFITMEYIEGKPLSDPIYQQECDLSLFYHWFVPLADALAHAHEHGVSHRDIKPGNIRMTLAGMPKLLDFGLARIQQEDSDGFGLEQSWATGEMMGTPAYMSPEQAEGKAVGSATDIFSLGVICYEFLSGQHPFEADTQGKSKQAVISQTPLAPSHHKPEIPRALESLILQMLEKEPSRRPRAAAVKQRLAQLAEEHKQQDDHTRSVRTRLTKRLRISLFLLGAILLVGSVTAFFYFNRRPVLTDKDTILLTDFINQTGEEIFDDALKKSLALHLEQSPYLNLFADERVRETLRLMNRSPDERVTPSVGREICQRQGLKALLTGSIASLGRNYVINLEAINAQTGDVLAHEQVEASEKEQVLRKLGEAANRLREKLGESLSSIQQFDVPLEQVTTSSLEALKAFTIGSDLNAKGKYIEAIVSLKHAVELDPNFARAWSVLSRAYSNSGQLVLAVEPAQKAFELRERVTEREKLHIAAQYYSSVTGDLHKEIETLELLKRTYPNDVVARRNLGSRYNTLGQYEQAIVELREAIRLNPDYGSPYRNLVTAYLRLSRIDEARAMADQVVARGFDSINSRTRLFDIAFIQGDTAAMQQQIDWASRRPGEYEHLMWQAHTAHFAGKLWKSQEFRTSAFELAQQRNRLDDAGAILLGKAAIFAIMGNCRQSLAILTRARTLPAPPLYFIAAASSYAQCGALAQSQALIDELILRYPKNTELNEVVVPQARAELEYQRGNHAKAIQLLQTVSRYEANSHFSINYLRGQAWLGEGNGAAAAKEYQKILDNPGWGAMSLYIPLAHLGLARAAVLQGDTANARKSYQDFFTLWKDADADIPILIEAKREYEKVK